MRPFKSTIFRSAIAWLPILAANAGPIIDFNPSPAGGPTQSLGFLTADLPSGVTVFTMTDVRSGLELWATDGTPSGTRLVRDIRPGPTGSGIRNLTALNGVAYFFADDGVNGLELWRSDGTAAGTRIVANIGSGGAAGVIGSLVTLSIPETPIASASGVLYFSGNDGSSGWEPWRSDGTAAGTWRVADLHAGAASSDPVDFEVAGARVFFSAVTSSTPSVDLWMISGGATTRLATTTDTFIARAAVGDTYFYNLDRKAVRLRANASSPTLISGLPDSPGMLSFGDTVLFTAGAFPTAWYVLDVNADAATLVGNLSNRAGYGVSIPVGKKALIGFVTGLSPFYSLYVSDGTVANTVPVSANITLPFSERKVARANDFALFLTTGSEIWRTDGTNAGTVAFANLGHLSSSDADFSLLGLKAFYPGPDGELWSSDGTSNGSQLAVDLRPGGEPANPRDFRMAANRILFTAVSPSGSRVVHVSDGTANGTFATVSVASATEDSIAQVWSVAGQTWVNAITGPNGAHRMFSTDGTAAGTHLLRPDFPYAFEAVHDMDGFTLFYSRPSDVGTLWRTDGTDAGTVPILDFTAPYPIMTSEYEHTSPWAVDYFFVSKPTGGGFQLWRTDGTTAGTLALKDLPISPQTGTPRILGGLGSRVIFLVPNYPGGGRQGIWVSDGTEAGTVELSVVDAILLPRLGPAAYVMNGKLCFAARLVAGGPLAIQCTNGLSASYETISSGAGINRLGPRINSTSVAFARADATGVFVTDGTLASERKVADGWSLAETGARLGNGLIDFATYGDARTFLYTDGTAAGTREWIPGRAELKARMNTQPIVVGGNLIFTAHTVDSYSETEVWVSDGTDAGTRLWWTPVASAGHENTDWQPSGFVASGNKLYFMAHEEDTGMELWAVDPALPFAMADVATIPASGPGTIDILGNDMSFGSTINKSSVVIETPPLHGSVSVNSITGAVTFTPGTDIFGTDEFEYRVSDIQNRVSNVARVTIYRTPPVGPGPGTAPVSPPPVTPPPPPTTPGGSTKKSGGGALGLELAFLLSMLMYLQRRKVHIGMRTSQASRSWPRGRRAAHPPTK